MQSSQGSGYTRSELFVAWTTWFERVGADDSAVVLVIDDAQHAEEGLLDFLEHLLASSRSGVFVLALARPELLVRRPGLGGRRTSVVRLVPLDDTAMAQLADGLVVGLTDRSRAALVRRAEGIPLFAVETVRALIDRDAVVPRDGVYVHDSPGANSRWCVHRPGRNGRRVALRGTVDPLRRGTWRS